MSFVEKAKVFVVEKKMLVIGLTLTLVLGGGGFLGWKKYTYSQSPQAFIEQLNTALTATDVTALATLIDFRTLTEDLAKNILAQPMPSKSSTPKSTEVPLLAEDIQKFFLQNLQNTDTAKTPATEDPLAPLMPLPPDFIKQVSGKFIFQTQTQEGAITSVRIHYPRLEKDFTFYFLAKQKPHWRIERVMNTKELVQAYIKEDSTLERGRKKLYDIQREKDRKRIESQFRVEECTAFIHRPNGQTTPNLIVRIRGYNQGPFIIRNMTFATKVYARNANGEIAFSQKLNSAARINVGTLLEDSYTHELETESKEAKFLLEVPEVSCEAHVHFMTLDNGQLLFLADDETYMGKPLPKK